MYVYMHAYVCVCVYFSRWMERIDIANLTTRFGINRKFWYTDTVWKHKTQRLKTVSYFFAHSRMEK